LLEFAHNRWHDGTFMDVAYELGGDALEGLFTFGAAVSVIGLLCTLICASARIIYGMVSSTSIRNENYHNNNYSWLLLAVASQRACTGGCPPSAPLQVLRGVSVPAV
jgi:hypothetical protein